MTDELIERIKAGAKWGGTCTDASYVQEMEARILADAAIIKAAEELAKAVELMHSDWMLDEIASALAAYRAAVSERDT